MEEGPKKDVRCTSCSASYRVSRSETRPFICAVCSAIVDPDPRRKLMRVVC